LVGVLTLFLAGGEVLRGFSFAVFIGVLIGTYSSVFIASPVVLDFYNMQQRKEKKKKTEPAK
jgi:SecD/SecF fusion protein